MCNIFCVLLATLGGFGLLIAAVLPQIRCYNRISIYIGFFSLFALVLTLDRLRPKTMASRTQKILYAGFLGLLLIGGVLDQTPYIWAGSFQNPAFQEDAEFVAQVEAAVPTGAMMLSTPLLCFP